MKRRVYNVVWCMLTLVISGLLCQYSVHALALTIPEKLTYDLTWTGIKAGTATQEIIAEKDRVRIISTARSADWLSVFFEVEDLIETTLIRIPGQSLGLPRTYRMNIREGNHRRDREIRFDHEAGKAQYIDHLVNENVELEITRNTYDLYTGFYYVRSIPLEVGKSVFISILDGKELYNLEVQTLRKERIKTALGEFNTIKIKPVMKSEGIFQKKGNIYIWLTDDARRLPVKMQSKVFIGSVTATLVGVSSQR
ncbi:MAG: DUF3108 domain-containing protein [Geobacteraceae bacterium]